MTTDCEHYLNTSNKFLFEKNGYKIVECQKCGQRFTEIGACEDHVATVYSDQYFFEGKTGYPNYLKQRELLYRYGQCYVETISRYLKPGRVLDVGCAAGFILKAFVDSGWEGAGVEPNATMADYGRKELKLNIITGCFETFKSDERFDLIKMIQVIGHFYSLDQVLSKLKTNLNPNGMILVESWDIKSVYAKLMGKRWHEYSPPSVIRWFSDDSLCALFEQHGFTLVAKDYPDKKINLSHALSLIEEKLFYFPFKKRTFCFLNSILGKYNVKYPFRDLKWYLFHQKK